MKAVEVSICFPPPPCGNLPQEKTVFFRKKPASNLPKKGIFLLPKKTLRVSSQGISLPPKNRSRLPPTRDGRQVLRHLPPPQPPASASTRIRVVRGQSWYDSPTESSSARRRWSCTTQRRGTSYCMRSRQCREPQGTRTWSGLSRSGPSPATSTS